MSELRTILRNHMKEKLGRGEVVASMTVRFVRSIEIAAIAKTAGFDTLYVDLEHNTLSIDTCCQICISAQQIGITPLVRVPANTPEYICRVLDGGAMGVICPMVNTAAEAKQLADACLYPPAGKRSNGPIRAAMYGEASSYQATANNEILVIPMIETQQAINNIDEILSVPGINGIYIGPSDMGLSLGMIPILDREEPIILEIYGKLLASCKRHGKFAGIHNGTAAYAARMMQMGFQLCTIANDSGLMARAAREAVTATRKAAGEIAA